MSPTTGAFNREQLVTALRDEGIRFLAGGSEDEPSQRIAPDDLIYALAAHPDPR